jgi:hypothetical protein
MNLEENVPVHPGKFRLFAVILIAVFIFAVGGVGGYWVGSRQQQSSPTTLKASSKPSWIPSTPPFQSPYPTPTIAPSKPDPISDWKTYRNEEYGFEVKYPPGWSIHYEATQKDIFETLSTNRKYRLDRPVELVSWQDGDAPYPDTGDISFLLYTDPLTEQFIATRTTSYKDVEVQKRVINGRAFTEIYLSFLGKGSEGPSFAFSKEFYTIFPHGAFRTLSLSGLGYDDPREQLEEILERMVSSLKIT